jgi:hypothetical protein
MAHCDHGEVSNGCNSQKFEVTPVVLEIQAAWNVMLCH